MPKGTDWLEYMLNAQYHTPRRLVVMHHLALGVPVVAAGYEKVVERGKTPKKPKLGRDGKWQLNLYDPNLTRVELMEPKPPLRRFRGLLSIEPLGTGLGRSAESQIPTQ